MTSAKARAPEAARSPRPAMGRMQSIHPTPAKAANPLPQPHGRIWRTENTVERQRSAAPESAKSAAGSIQPCTEWMSATKTTAARYVDLHCPRRSGHKMWTARTAAPAWFATSAVAKMVVGSTRSILGLMRPMSATSARAVSPRNRPWGGQASPTGRSVLAGCVTSGRVCPAAGSITPTFLAGRSTRTIRASSVTRRCRRCGAISPTTVLADSV